MRVRVRVRVGVGVPRILSQPSCSQLLCSAIAAMEIGLRCTEAVVRLSPDQPPFVIQGLEHLEDSQWIRLTRKDTALSKLLAGKRRNILNKCSVFDKIADSHRLALVKLRAADIVQEDGSPDTPGPVDKAALLGLGDDEEVRTSRRKTKKKRLELTELPLAVAISVDIGEDKEPWVVRALTGTGRTGRKAVAIEFTVDNMRMLRSLVLDEVSTRASPPTPASARRSAARPPRVLGDGSREYYCGRAKRWVIKKVVAKGKYRCLTRKATPLEPPPASLCATALPEQASGSAGAHVDRADALGLGD